MDWIARHRRRLAITFVGFVGAISAAFGGFFGGRFLHHHADLGGSSDWGYLNGTFNAATWLCLLALICGVMFLVLVWRRGHRHDDRLA
jgi:MFS family permease